MDEQVTIPTVTEPEPEPASISSYDLSLINPTPAPPPAPEPASISSYDLSLINPTPAPPPAPISLDDLLATNQMLLKKEADDKSTLESIGTISYEELKTKLIGWASSGFPNAYEIHRVTITPPTLCSDGVSRDLPTYIEFCSGKTINQHVDLLQAKVTGMVISFANMGGYISIVVTKAQSS